jgi:hypothetical protein
MYHFITKFDCWLIHQTFLAQIFYNSLTSPSKPNWVKHTTPTSPLTKWKVSHYQANPFIWVAKKTLFPPSYMPKIKQPFFAMYIKVKTLNKTLDNCVCGNKKISEQLATLLWQLVSPPVC